MSTVNPYHIPETADGDIGEVNILAVELGRCTIKIACPVFPERLLDLGTVHEAFAADEYMPYWATLWPVGKFLSSEILARPWPQGIRAVEIGCGLGLPGIAALMMGMDVLFTDYDPTALKFVRSNCSLNGFTNTKTAILDLRSPLDQRFDVIIASDLIYERRNVEPLVELISTSLAPGGTALVADQNRPYQENFLTALKERGFRWTVVTKGFLNQDHQPVIGSIFTITRD